LLVAVAAAVTTVLATMDRLAKRERLDQAVLIRVVGQVLMVQVAPTVATVGHKMAAKVLVGYLDHNVRGTVNGAVQIGTRSSVVETRTTTVLPTVVSGVLEAVNTKVVVVAATRVGQVASTVVVVEAAVVHGLKRTESSPVSLSSGLYRTLSTLKASTKRPMAMSPLRTLFQ
jgi:hypothetical protein